VLLPLWLCTLLVPINDRLIRYHIGVVEYLHELREGFDDSRIGVAVYLNGVDESDFSFRPIAEGFEYGSVRLQWSFPVAQVYADQKRGGRKMSAKQPSLDGV